MHYAATEYVCRIQDRQVAVSMAAEGEPRGNGYAERLMRTIKEEQVELTAYLDFHKERQQLGRFIAAVPTRKMIHSALGQLTPDDLEQQWQRGPAGCARRERPRPARDGFLSTMPSLPTFRGPTLGRTTPLQLDALVMQPLAHLPLRQPLHAQGQIQQVHQPFDPPLVL